MQVLISDRFAPLDNRNDTAVTIIFDSFLIFNDLHKNTIATACIKIEMTELSKPNTPPFYFVSLVTVI